jgi:acyl-CoA synthetase (NDP forming)
MDLSATDFFDFLLSDIESSRKGGEGHYGGVSVVGLYIEGFNEGDGKRLMSLAEKAKKMGVMLALYKSGRTAAGREAAKGHTASMAGDYDMFSFLLRTVGAIVCDSFEEFEHILMACALMPSFASIGSLPRETPASVGMMSNAGFEKCALADHLFRGNPKSVVLPTWTPETSAKIEDLFTKCGLKGVIDISPVLDVTPMLSEENWIRLSEIMIEDTQCHACILSTVPESVNFKVLPKGDGHSEDMLGPGGFVERMAALKEKHGAKKPFVVSMESGALYDPVSAALMEKGIPVFRRADSAARAVGKIVVAMKGEVI